MQSPSILSLLCSERSKAFVLVSSILGVYFFVVLEGYLIEKMTTYEYLNNSTGEKQKYVYPLSFVIYTSLFCWILGELMQRGSPPKETDRAFEKECMKVGLIKTFSILLFYVSFYILAYPIVIMLKSSSLIFTVAIGIFCSKVEGHHLKLGRSKIIIAISIATGILLYNCFG